VVQQLEAANEDCDFVTINPVDRADIELTKVPMQANYGGPYVVGNPLSTDVPNLKYLWGRAVLVTNNITSGSFLAGNSRQCGLFVRQDATVEVSTEHSDFFTKNLVAIRCEGRMAFCIYRSSAFITGSFVTSP
jgi:HK97 family phage major capsid protein